MRRLTGAVLEKLRSGSRLTVFNPKRLPKMDLLHIPCNHCSAVNKLPVERIGAGARCGRCKQSLFDGKTGTLTAGNASALLGWTELPVVIDCWAAWCGPCKQFGPVFEQTARQFGTRARFLKLDTETEQQMARKFNIRSIPTLIVMRKGQEVARQSGAMSPGQFQAWLAPHLQGPASDTA